MFDAETIAAVEEMAEGHNPEPAVLLAVAEVERAVKSRRS